MRNYRCTEFVVWMSLLQRQRRKQYVKLKKLRCREVIVAKRFAVEVFLYVLIFCCQIVWDPVKKKWMNADGTEEETASTAPPPKDTELMGRSLY